MSNFEVHLSDEDDLYAGYNEYPSAFNTKDINEDLIIQEALRTSHVKRPMHIAKLSSAVRMNTSSGNRESTGSWQLQSAKSQDGVNRPMTAVRGAGYTSAHSTQIFDHLSQGSKGPSPSFDMKKEELYEEKIKKLEKKIVELIEESCFANRTGDHRTALEKAKDASATERNLISLQEQGGIGESHNLELTFSVLFNLASQYAANDMYSEALNTYHVITKNKMFSNASRLKMNMGNIYFKLGQYPKAIKFYHMALDQVPNTHKELRIKIMHNIAILYVKMGQFSDACSSFEYIMQEKPDFKTGLHVIVCYYALGDKEKMKKAFTTLLEIPLVLDDERYINSTSDDHFTELILEVVKNDTLRKMERLIKQDAERCILTAANLISPVIENTFTEGYNWCVESIKASNFMMLASDLEINKAVMFLRQKEFPLAVETLKTFEKKTSKVASSAATNLSFIHIFQGDLDQACKYAEKAHEADSYNSYAYVNLGTCSFLNRDLEKARELYLIALDNDASCVEALFNLGLVNKQLKLYDKAVNCFLKLQTIIRHHPQVLFHLAHLHELLGNMEQAAEWYHQLLGIVTTDPGLLQKMGEVYESEGDKQLAYQYHYDSFRHFPSNFEIIDWMGSYYLEMQVAEKAIPFFECAALMQPEEVKWQLMIASCHRRCGNHHQALSLYKAVLRKHPDNIDCLKLLIRLCNDLGLKEAEDFEIQLRKAEKSREVREKFGHTLPESNQVGNKSSSEVTGGYQSRPGSEVNFRQSAGSRNSLNQLPADTAKRLLHDHEEQYIPTQRNYDDADISYSDPLGPLPERPLTSAGRKLNLDDEFGDDDLAADLLPD